MCQYLGDMQTALIVLLAVTSALGVQLGKRGNYDPNMYLDTASMIRRQGYPAECHTVQTADGYLLTLHRIPHGKGESNTRPGDKPVVFLHHCLFSKNLAVTSLLLQASMIRRQGYPAECHTVQTADGYLLTLHRIPHGKGESNTRPGDKPVVFLHHCLFSSSAHWVIVGPGKALAYLLADAGYDVWMGNARGNTYSRAHVSLSPHDTSFWDFSFHEMGMLDLPASIDHALTTSTRTSLTFIGHSMGATASYVLASSLPEYSRKIAAIFSLAPAAYMGHIRGPLGLLGVFTDDLKMMARLLGVGEVLPQSEFFKLLMRVGCDADVTERFVCENLLFMVCGFDPQQFNQSLLPRILSHFPAGASAKTLIHYGQIIRSHKFRQFDHGKEGNLKVYGQPTPPDYQLSKVQVPVSLHFSDNDLCTDKVDVLQLARELPNVIGKFKVPLASFNHLDFLTANDVKTLVYDNLMEVMRKYAQVHATEGRPQARR